MSAKCDVCGKMATKYTTTSHGDTVCVGTCLKVYRLESYLLTMEEHKERDEENNLEAYRQAREMSAWLSIWKFGSIEQRNRATKALNAW